MKETILQFGTGNFLRGFADYFINEMNERGLYDGKVVIVSPTDSKAVEKINGQKGKYNLYLRGIENGKEVCNRYEINSVSRAVNPYVDFSEYLELAKNPDLRFIISNTTEAGIKFDDSCKAEDKPALAFPAKLTQFLYERFRNNLGGFVILACELIDHNGDELKKCVLEYSKLWKLGDDFIRWIETENAFCNTLVDRIVTGYPKEEAESIFSQIGYRDELLDTAEPYHLWVIEGDYENELPLKKAGFNVIWTDDVSPFKKMKVRILNGAHTSLVFASMLSGIETVCESINDNQLSSFLDCCLNNYILPVLDDTDEIKSFAAAVLERFANPYIRHLWKSISLNSVSKFSVRVLPTILDYIEIKNEIPRPLVFSLACLIEYYKTNDVQDDPLAVDYIKNNDVDAILKNSALWGSDLSFATEIVNQSSDIIHSRGIREAVQWSIS